MSREDSIEFLLKDDSSAEGRGGRDGPSQYSQYTFEGADDIGLPFDSYAPDAMTLAGVCWPEQEFRAFEPGSDHIPMDDYSFTRGTTHDPSNTGFEPECDRPSTIFGCQPSQQQYFGILQNCGTNGQQSEGVDSEESSKKKTAPGTCASKVSTSKLATDAIAQMLLLLAQSREHTCGCEHVEQTLVVELRF
jgi:hypothetical protein